ncbi:hypothetical protein TRL7639_00139 [Falsiruegeria litorea R37]|uniref:Uncharacterized protein n=1 Tax=Falsiruegeria litorea R37 TaxID=1200284 RepID=A0A1Y5RBI9_9RHOB|nr:hypothetical protein [Falsiruegeria litorea]SLN12822.1 hypothetical protein TRL7639_00139 [Falsiruegeria litorea R37]
MTYHPELEFASSAERLKTLANLVELALYAPEGEVTFEGRAALQRAAREIVILADEVTGVVGIVPN